MPVATPARSVGPRVKLSWLKYGLLLFLFLMLNVHVSIFVYQRFHPHIKDNPAGKIGEKARHHAQDTARTSVAGEERTPRPLDTVAAALLTKVENSTEHTPQLPTFATDFSEFAFSSLIEREFDSFDLHVTTFLMSHLTLDPSTGTSAAGRVHPDAEDDWNRLIEAASHTEYHLNGMRKQHPQMQYFCHISNSLGSERYSVEATFLPNRLTADGNSNRLLDIMRCKMSDTEEAYRRLAGSQKAVQVDLLRGSKTVLSFSGASIDIHPSIHPSIPPSPHLYHSPLVHAPHRIHPRAATRRLRPARLVRGSQTLAS